MNLYFQKNVLDLFIALMAYQPSRVIYSQKWSAVELFNPSLAK